MRENKSKNWGKEGVTLKSSVTASDSTGCANEGKGKRREAKGAMGLVGVWQGCTCASQKAWRNWKTENSAPVISRTAEADITMYNWND